MCICCVFVFAVLAPSPGFDALDRTGLDCLVSERAMGLSLPCAAGVGGDAQFGQQGVGLAVGWMCCVCITTAFSVGLGFPAAPRAGNERMTGGRRGSRRREGRRRDESSDGAES